jgi:hypothetical protein
VELRVCRSYLGEPFTKLIQKMAEMRFHVLQQQLSQDIGFARDTGIADCRLAMLYAFELATESSRPVRPATGLLMTTPYPMSHCWLEFQVGSRWHSADPFMLSALARWQIIDREKWPPNRSLQASLWRLSEDHQMAYATHNGDNVHPSFNAILSCSG